MVFTSFLESCNPSAFQCCRWKEAISVAESQNHPDAAKLKQGHFEWLLETSQAGYSTNKVPLLVSIECLDVDI